VVFRVLLIILLAGGVAIWYVRHKEGRAYRTIRAPGDRPADRSPVHRGKQGMKRSSTVDEYGIPLDRILAAATWQTRSSRSVACPPDMDSLPMGRPTGATSVMTHLPRGL